MNDLIWDDRFHFATRHRTLYRDISSIYSPRGLPHASLSASNSLLARSVIKWCQRCVYLRTSPYRDAKNAGCYYTHITIPINCGDREEVDHSRDSVRERYAWSHCVGKNTAEHLVPWAWERTNGNRIPLPVTNFSVVNRVFTDAIGPAKLHGPNESWLHWKWLQKWSLNYP